MTLYCVHCDHCGTDYPIPASDVRPTACFNCGWPVVVQVNTDQRIQKLTEEAIAQRGRETRG